MTEAVRTARRRSFGVVRIGDVLEIRVAVSPSRAGGLVELRLHRGASGTWTKQGFSLPLGKIGELIDALHDAIPSGLTP